MDTIKNNIFGQQIEDQNKNGIAWKIGDGKQNFKL